jgi:insulysin
VRKKLFFPEPNAFIPTRLAVKSQLLLPTPSENATPRIADRPQIIIHNDRTRAWFKQDQQFQVPKANINLRLKLPLVAADAEGAAQAQLFAALIMDELNEFSYPASLAGLDYSVRANTRGFDITIAGYSSRQGLLLSKIAKAIRKGRFSQERFNSIKQELIRSWRNDSKNTPYIVLAQQIPVLQYEPYWSSADLIAGLANKNLEEFHQFSTRVLRDGTMEALLYGNLFRQEAIKLAALAEYELLGSKTGTPQPLARLYQLSANKGKPWLYRHHLDHNDNIVQLYVQGIQPLVADAAHMKLLQQILQPAFFDRLRTEKQLGYIVSVFPMPIRNLEGSVFVVQSPSTDEAKIIEEIDVFLDSFSESLSNHLAENKLALVRQLNEPARTLAEQADYYWDSILLGDDEFNRRQQVAAAVAAITPESLMNYYRAVMLDKNRRLWLTSQKISDSDAFNIVDDISGYRKQQQSLVYP